MAKKKKSKSAKVHKDLKKLDLKINSLGQVESNIDIDQLNKFLDEHVEDKKLISEEKKKKK